MRFQRPAVAVAAVTMSAALALATASSAAATPATSHQVQESANPGDAEPSLSLSVSPAGKPEIASVARDGSLWLTAQSAGKWHRTRIAGPGSADSGPSLFAGPAGDAVLAVQGPNHSLRYYLLLSGHWHHSQIAGKNTAFSAPSLAEGPAGPGVAVQGPNHSLRYYFLHNGKWKLTAINGSGTAFSAPSLVIRLADQATTTDPAGEIDIAVQNASHSLSYYKSLPDGHFQNDVIGPPGSTYSAPSLVIFGGTDRSRSVGVPVIMVQGASHTLVRYVFVAMWRSDLRETKGWVFSAPALVQGNSITEQATAFQGASRSIVLTYFNTDARGWQNDVFATPASGYSAPSLVVRSAHPEGELDLAIQGQSNRLRYYTAPVPKPGFAAAFTGRTLAGKGTTFGG